MATFFKDPLGCPPLAASRGDGAGPRIVLPRFAFVPLRDALRRAGHAVAYAVLRAPLAVCRSRAGARDSQPLADPEVVERLWHDFADLAELEPHAVDLDEEGREDAAGLVDARLPEGSLRA